MTSDHSVNYDWIESEIITHAADLYLIKYQKRKESK